MKKAERRDAERIVIAGAKVHYKLENGETGTTRIENLTKNSICIQLQQRVLNGQPIDLDLIIPDRPVISVKAKIVWVLPRGSYAAGSNVGIQFRPFGDEEKNNPLKTAKQMEKIIHEYQ
jgi:Tfp pilus assembly protein PilZ